MQKVITFAGFSINGLDEAADTAAVHHSAWLREHNSEIMTISDKVETTASVVPVGTRAVYWFTITLVYRSRI